MSDSNNTKGNASIVEVDNPPTELEQSEGLANTSMTAGQLKTKLKQVTEKQKVIDEFIKENFIEGCDFDVAYAGAAKKTLLKPGAEKICLLFNLEAKYYKDEETLSMLPDELQKGTICYVCELIDRKSGARIGEGRGACTLDEKSTYDKYKKVSVAKVNTSIKIAQKRAKVDAVLNTAGLSDRFTQDAGDTDSEAGGIGKEAQDLVQKLVAATTQKQVETITKSVQDPKAKWSYYELEVLRKTAVDAIQRIKERTDGAKTSTSDTPKS